MRGSALVIRGLWGATALISCTLATHARGAAPVAINLVDKSAAIERFVNDNPRAAFSYLGEQIHGLYGPAISTGQTAVQSAENFRQKYTDMWGVNASDLIPVGPFEDGRFTQPIMFIPETGKYKFTGVYYAQVRDGVPVFRGQIMVLARNVSGNPIVLASSDLRDIGTFRANATAL